MVGKFVSAYMACCRMESVEQNETFAQENQAYFSKHRGFSFDRNCALRRWESETLK